MEQRGWLRRAVHRMTAPDEELEAEDLRDEAAKVGATQLTTCCGGEQVRVCGTVRSVTLRPVAGAPALEAELYDGTGTVTLVFLGRHRIGGIDAGRRLVACGRVTDRDGNRTIFNPRYDLLPAEATTA